MLVFCTVIFTVTGNGKAANSITPNDNVTYDEKEPREIFEGPTESKRVVDVGVKFMASGEGVSLGQYTLKEGDMIIYNIMSEGKGNLNIFFMKTDEYLRDDGSMGESEFTGNTLRVLKEYPIVFPSSLAGIPS